MKNNKQHLLSLEEPSNIQLSPKCQEHDFGIIIWSFSYYKLRRTQQSYSKIISLSIF